VNISWLQMLSAGRASLSDEVLRAARRLLFFFAESSNRHESAWYITLAAMMTASADRAICALLSANPSGLSTRVIVPAAS
jgi:hypothetical protein